MTSTASRPTRSTQASLNPLTGSHYEAGFNLTQPPFDNKQLRQALSYAMDRKRFVDTILGGVGARGVAAVAAGLARL